MTGTDDVDIRLDEDTLQDRDDLDLQAEVDELRRTVDHLKDLVYEQQQEIEKLKSQEGAATDHLPEIENFARDDAYQGLTDYQHRVTEIWAELPKHAGRNAEKGKPTYSLDYSRLCDALADVDPDEWGSGEKVDSSQARYARKAMEDIAPCRIVDKGAGKKIVVNIAVWATYRPDKVARALMRQEDIQRHLMEDG